MAKLRFEIEGQAPYVAVRTYVAAMHKLLSLLREIDQIVSGQYHGSLRWYVAALHDDDHAIGIDVVSRVRPPRKKDTIPTDFSSTVTRSLVTGFENVEVYGTSPPYLSEYGLGTLNEMVAILSKNGAKGYRATDMDSQRSVTVTHQSAENLKQLLPIRRQSLGSISGKLEAISIRRRKKFVVYHTLTNKAVSCEFQGDDTLRLVADMLGERVKVDGVVHFNGKGEPVRVEMETIIPLVAGSLRARDLAGSHPDITDGLTVEEYMRSIRGD